MTGIARTTSILGACIAPNHHGQGHGHHTLTGEFVWGVRQGLLRGMRIQQRVHHEDGTVTWGPFDEVLVEPPVEATEFVSLGGHGTAYMDGTRWVTYNQSSQPKLNNSGDAIRLVDSNGLVIDQKIFAAQSCDVLPPAPRPVVKPPVVVPPAPHYSPWKKR